MKKPKNYTLRELGSHEMPSILPLIQQLNAKLTERHFRARLKQMQAQHYRCLGVFDGARLVGICGFWIFTRFWCGKQMDLDNFVVDASLRGSGVGSQMLTWLEALAKREKVETIVLDSYAASHDTHRFYFRHGYFIKGYHFIKPLVSGPMTGKAVKTT
jgi:GNAT superfamily N-acetyltransferase